MRKISPVSRAVSVIAAVALSLGLSALPAQANGEVFTVMNTSESPPDGVYFRNSPHTADTSRVTGLGVYMNEQVRVSCFGWGDPVGSYGNTMWYYVTDVSRPTAPNGAANVGWINTHYVNDGMNANQAYPGVTDCNATPPPPPPPPPAPVPQTDWKVVTDQYLFAYTMPQFLTVRRIVGVGHLDWTTDGCSVGPIAEPARSQPAGYDFRGPCWRHDFGYRNYKAQNRFTEAARQIIDDNFHSDMYNVCNRYTGWSAWKGVQCRRIADGFYTVVRGCGANPAPACPDQVWHRTQYLLTTLRYFA